MTLYLRENRARGGQDLILSWLGTSEFIHELVAVPSLAEAAFEYDGGEGGDVGWTPSWNENVPPAFVRLRFRPSPSAETTSVVVKPALDIAAFCALAPNERCWSGR